MVNLYPYPFFDQGAAIEQGQDESRMLQIYKELIITATIIFRFNPISDIYNIKREILTAFTTLYTLFIHNGDKKARKHEIIEPYLRLTECDVIDSRTRKRRHPAQTMIEQKRSRRQQPGKQLGDAGKMSPLQR